MSKRTEIKKYIKLKGDDDYINSLVRSNRVIFGDFINSKIYYESNTLLPKTGILIQKENDLVFYGAKSLLEKEFILTFPYENIYLSQNSGFSISFTYREYNKKKDKCKFSISWEDYITKNIKPDFVYKLGLKIKDKLIKVALNFLKDKNTSNEAYYYYHRILSEKITDITFIMEFISLSKYEAEIECEGIDEMYDNIISKKTDYLATVYPDHKDIITKKLGLRLKGHERNGLSTFPDIKKNGRANKNEKIYSAQMITPRVQKIIDDKIREGIETIKEQLLQDYHEKVEEFSNKIELEKKIYREIIKDNITLMNEIELGEADSDKLVDTLTNFYYRYKLLNDKLPDTFTIPLKKPDQGKNTLLFILESLSQKYLKVIDPYIFASELELFKGIPDDIDIKIITYSLGLDTYKDKLKEFKQKLEEFRNERFGKVEVKIIRFYKRNQTPIHDRAIFSNDWGLSFSNSLSQIGAKHDLTVRRIMTKEREISGFDDFWYIASEMKRGNKILKVSVTEL